MSIENPDHVEVVWLFDRPSHALGPLVTSGPYVFFGTQGGRVYAVHSRDGWMAWENLDPVHDMRFHATAGAGLYGEPDVYVGGKGESLSPIIHHFRADGTMSDVQIELPSNIYALFFAHDWNDHTGGLFVATVSNVGKYYLNGSPAWQRQWSGGTYYGATALVDEFEGNNLIKTGKVLLHSTGSQLRAIDGTDGNELWSYEAEDDIAGVAAHQGIVVIGLSRGHRLIGLDLESGEQRWVRDVEGNRNDNLYPVGVTRDGAVLMRGFTLMVSVRVEDGTENWRIRPRSDVGDEHGESFSNAVIDLRRNRNEVYASVQSADGPALYCIDLGTGRQNWRFDRFEGITQISDVAISALDDGHLLFHDGARLYALRVNSN